MRAGSALALLGTAFAAAAAGCSSEQPALPRDCLAGRPSVARALASAPRAVLLEGGTRLSTCVERADSEAELQDVGIGYVNVAESLAAVVPRSDAAALQLGYLVGASRRGAARTNGVGAELVRRLEQAVGVDGPPAARRVAYRRGIAAGERDG